MNYQRIYDQIIDRARSRKLEGYKETHHTIPKCMGGSNKKENLVDLTAREHFICHILLTQIYPTNGKLKFAAWAMANQKKEGRTYEVSSRLYEALKQDFIAEHRATYSGTNHPSYGKQGPMKGKTHSDTTKKQMSISGLGKKQSPEHIANRFKDRVEFPSFKGQSHSEETLALLRVPKGPQKQVTCPHCNLSGGVSNMTRHHFNNCKKVAN